VVSPQASHHHGSWETAHPFGLDKANTVPFPSQPGRQSAGVGTAGKPARQNTLDAGRISSQRPAGGACARLWMTLKGITGQTNSTD